MLTHILQESWLTAKESAVYLACLELGEAQISKIARLAGQKRSTTYSVIKRLMEQGYAFEKTLQHTWYYSVLSPEALIEYRRHILEKLEKSLPELLALSHIHEHKPHISFFQWIEGIIHVYREIMNSTKDYVHSFLGTSEMDDKVAAYLDQDFDNEREAVKWFRAKVIVSARNTTTYAKKNLALHPCVVIDDDDFDFSNEIVLGGENKIAILLFGEHEVAGVLIKSMTLHKSLLSLHRLLWKAYK